MMSYHELTVNEPRNEETRRSNRRQVQVVLAVTVAVLAHALATSGAFQKVDIQHGTFPGGEYVYKFTNRDYAAAMSLSRSIIEDLSMDPRADMDVIHTLHLDDPLRAGGRHQRFAGGLLLVDGSDKVKKEKNKEWKKILLQKNSKPDEQQQQQATTTNIPSLPPNEQHGDIDVQELWPQLQYQVASLPKVPVAVVTFPFTDGIASALVHTYKIFPQLHQYVAKHGEKGSVPVVVTTCNMERQICTHYAPLAKASKFLLGHPDQETYLKSVLTNDGFDWSRVARNLQKLIPFAKK